MSGLGTQGLANTQGKTSMTDSMRWWLLSFTFITGWLIYLLAPVLTPFVTAAVLAYIGDPLVDRLELKKVPRTLAVALVFVLLSVIALILLLVLVPMIEEQLRILATKLPVYIEWIQATLLPWLNLRLSAFDVSIDLGSLKQTIKTGWQSASGVLSGLMQSITRSGLAVAAWLANLVLIPVVAFYLLRDWDILIQRINELIPHRSQAVVARLARQADEVLGAFLRGQMLVMLALAIIYSVGLSIVGLDLAVLIGFIAGLVSFVPYLGFIVGIVMAGIAALMQFQDGIHLVYIAMVFGVGQMVEGMLLTPLLVGDRIGLHPVAVIFAILAGGQLFGFIGVLLALPVAAIIAVLLRFAHERYKDSKLYAG